MERNFQDELKRAQQNVKQLGATRDKLIGDARYEENRVKQAVEQLASLGVENADKLTIDELKKLQAQTQKKLEADFAKLQEQIAEGQKLVQEYEAAASA